MASAHSYDDLDDQDSSLPCSEKLAFDTQADAEAMSVTTHWRYGTALYAYECQHCQLWHLASKS